LKDAPDRGDLRLAWPLALQPFAAVCSTQTGQPWSDPCRRHPVIGAIAASGRLSCLRADPGSSLPLAFGPSPWHVASDVDRRVPALAQEDDDMITLYGFGRIFPEGHGETKDLWAQWALEETGLPYRVHALDHTGGELQTEAYGRLSPFRQAPVIDDDGFVVAKSAASSTCPRGRAS
jgi:hypothetical protein